MGLFNFLRKKEQPEESKSNVLLAMLMFDNGETFEVNKVVDYLKNHWYTNASDIYGNGGTVAFSLQGETVALATVAVQIPWGDIKGTAQYSYNWPTAEKDLEKHNSHIIVTVMSKNKSETERFGILTKVLSSILATSNCIGVYQGSQSLLIPKQQYLDGAEALKSNQIPINLWLYIGLQTGEKGNNGYTYGLTAFGKPEMEIINAKCDLQELHNLLSNICAYVINSNVTFKDGETLGYTAEQKIKIRKSKGQFVQGQTLKLEF